MLILKPNCELCDKDLGPASSEAFICTYECTFCRNCVEAVLENVCPNCGGGFSPRPVRPSVARRSGVSLSHQAASKERIHTKYTEEDIRTFARSIKNIPAGER